MIYRIEFRPSAEQGLAKLYPSIRRKVSAGIDKLAVNPRPFDVEKLKGSDGLYRVYAGPDKDYRVIYEIKDAIVLILVVKVGDRKDVYRSL